MSIIEKLSSMKDKTLETEQRISSIEKHVNELNSRVAGIDGVIKKLSDVEARMSDLTRKIDQKIAGDEKRIQSIESELNTKIASFLSDLNKFENWFKEREKLHNDDNDKQCKKYDSCMKETNSKMTMNEIHIKELESQIGSKLGKFVDETHKFETITKNQEKIREQLEAQMDNLLETIAKNQKEMQDNLNEFSSQKDLSALRSNLIKIDEVLKGSLKQTDTQLAEFDTRLNSFVEYDTLHKHIGEIKVDLATTEGNFRKIAEELKDDVDEIKSEAENYPKINELQEQNIDIMQKVKTLERKTDIDFEKILAEFQNLGTIFTKKAEFVALLKRLEPMSPKKLEQLQSELDVLKEQVISTQNAIVELNSFIQEQFR